MGFNEIIDRFKNLKYIGIVKGANAIGLSVEETCGEKLKLYLKIEDEKIMLIKFKIFGSPKLMVLSDLFCENALNKQIDEIKNYIENEFYSLILNYVDNTDYYLNLINTAYENAIKKYRRKFGK